jgi:hypothetical protein
MQRNHLPIAVRICHSYHESLQSCVVKVESLYEDSEASRQPLSPKTYMWHLVTINNSPSSGNRFNSWEDTTRNTPL